VIKTDRVSFSFSPISENAVVV